MRKYISIILIIIFTSSILSGCEVKQYKSNNEDLELEELNYDEIKDKLIRFHVIANSDTDEDQSLKLKVRDRVIDELSYKLKDTTSLEEARQVLIENIDNVNNIAKEVISENNYNYDVNTMVSYENFPDKVYGDYVFPQGNYEAFRVIIGSGQGQNWWCVMFPPLCFLDETKNSVDSKELKENIENISNEDDNKNNDKNKEKKVVFKSKIMEIISDLFD